MNRGDHTTLKQLIPLALCTNRRVFIICSVSLLAICFALVPVISLRRVRALTLQQTTDLGVTKSGPDTIAPGSNITYTITVVNNGPDDAADATLNDPLPTDTTFVSLSPPGG